MTTSAATAHDVNAQVVDLSPSSFDDAARAIKALHAVTTYLEAITGGAIPTLRRLGGEQPTDRAAYEAIADVTKDTCDNLLTLIIEALTPGDVVATQTGYGSWSARCPVCGWHGSYWVREDWARDQVQRHVTAKHPEATP
jgi:hypothetical protein